MNASAKSDSPTTKDPRRNVVCSGVVIRYCDLETLASYIVGRVLPSVVVQLANQRLTGTYGLNKE